MPLSRAYFDERRFFHLHFPRGATVGEVLRAYREQQGAWWWLLTTEGEGAHYVCSFGSLLPYLTGRTSHIIHNIGVCNICSAMDPLLWRATDDLVEEVLADEAICSRRVSSLPMAELPVIPNESIGDERDLVHWVVRRGLRACGVIEEGELLGVYVARTRGDADGMPQF